MTCNPIAFAWRQPYFFFLSFWFKNAVVCSHFYFLALKYLEYYEAFDFNEIQLPSNKINFKFKYLFQLMIKLINLNLI